METISLLSGVLLFSVLCLLPEVRANNCDWLLPDATRIRMRMQHNVHLMKVSQEVARRLQRDDSVITFDLAICMKAKQIQLKFQEEYKNTVIHMGGFHIALNYLSLIGKKYAYSGLEDLLIESGVYTAGTTSVVMLGKSYNRGIRAHSSVWKPFFVFSDKHFCSGWKIYQGRAHWQLEPPLIVHSRNDSGGSRP